MDPPRCLFGYSQTNQTITRAVVPDLARGVDGLYGSLGGASAAFPLAQPQLATGSVQTLVAGGTDHNELLGKRYVLQEIAFSASDRLMLTDSSILRRFVFRVCDPSKIDRAKWSELLAQQDMDGRRVLAAVSLEWIVWGAPSAVYSYSYDMGTAYDAAVTCWKSAQCDELLVALHAAVEIGP